MCQNTELLMVALELRLMAHQIGRGGRAVPATQPFQDRLTLAAETIEAMARAEPPVAATQRRWAARPAE